jgi:maleylacetoacetate isomerase
VCPHSNPESHRQCRLSIIHDRIVLELKGIPFKNHPINLVKAEHKTAEYLDMNPNAVVPSLKVLIKATNKVHVLTQSLAIIEWIDEGMPSDFTDRIKVIPDSKDAFKRAKVMSLAYLIACDVHPVQNLRVLKYVGEEKKSEWAKHFISLGFDGDFIILIFLLKFNWFTHADFMMHPTIPMTLNTLFK